MKRAVVFALSILAMTGAKAESVDSSFVYDKATCVKVAAEFQQNPFKVSLESLETFRQCVSTDLRKVQSRQYSQRAFRPTVQKLQDAE